MREPSRADYIQHEIDKLDERRDDGEVDETEYAREMKLIYREAARIYGPDPREGGDR